MLWRRFQFTFGEHQIEINIIFSFWFVGACHKYIVTKNIVTILRHTLFQSIRGKLIVAHWSTIDLEWIPSPLFQSIKGKLIIVHWGTIDLEWMPSPLNPCSSTCVVQTFSIKNILNIFFIQKVHLLFTIMYTHGKIFCHISKDDVQCGKEYSWHIPSMS
jgi:hypothetical protein